MVIQYNSLPFDLEIINEIGSKQIAYNRIDFCDDINDINSNILKNAITIRENSSASIHFTSNEQSRLEMDGFDGIYIEELQEDNRGKYLIPHNGYIEVFSYGKFPLPPGLYIIKVESNGYSYYTSFEVSASRIDERMWEVMAFDVFENIKLMAFQIAVQRKSIANNMFLGEIMDSLILKMNIIEKNFNKLIAALDGISNNPHSKISKSYVSCTISEHYPLDFKCNKLNSHKINFKSSYVPQKYTNYQLTENAYIKRIIIKLERLIRILINEISNKKNYINTKIDNDLYGKKRQTAEYNRNLNSLNFLCSYYTKAKIIRSALNRVKETIWFKSVNSNILKKFPSQSMLDPRYGILSKVSNELDAQNIKYAIDNSLSFIWHNSSKLYELWGIIKLVETFQKLGFELQKGFHVEKNGSELQISGLASLDSFILSKEDIVVKITYEPRLYERKSKDKTSIDTDPVYTVGTHTSPDCKIDFFFSINNEKFYIYSLIIDFKYRLKDSFWNDRKCREQLISYVDNTRSSMISFYDKNKSLNMRPVRFVWALYPDRYNVVAEDIDEDIYVKLISFVPGYQDVLEKHVRGFLDDFVYKEIDDLKRWSNQKI